MTASENNWSCLFILAPPNHHNKKLIKEEMAKLIGNNDNIDYGKLARVDIIGERARLLYVGITRAKRRLFCTAIRPSVYFKFIENYLMQEDKNA